MIKLTHQIVDQNYRLVGFIGEGKAKEFLGVSNEKVSRPISMKYIVESNFSNKQIGVRNGGIVEKEGFKLNSLDMKVIVGNNYIDVDNTIEILRRVEYNNENVGFDVRICGKQDVRFSYANVIKLSYLFRPTNFVIRRNDNKMFIAGKAGTSLSMIPAVSLGEKQNAKRTKPTTKTTAPITGVIENEVDIMSLYEYTRDIGGSIVNLPGTKYKSTTGSKQVAKEFVSMQIGEVATPYLDFNATKLNVSCNFRRPGAVAVELKPGSLTNITTFVHAKKNVFLNGENYISRLGVGVSNNKKEEFLNKFSKGVAISEITDNSIIAPIRMLTGQPNTSFYEVDTSKLGLIAKEKIDGYILNTNELYRKVLTLEENRVVAKYFRGLIKGAESNGEVAKETKDIAPQFAVLSDEELKVLSKNGIDIYSGAFTAKMETSEGEGHSGSKEPKADDTIEIAYAIDGLNADRIKAADMVADNNKLPNFLGTVIAKFNSIEDLGARVEKAREALSRVEASISAIRKELWLHKCAMWLKSNKLGIHGQDSGVWELNTKKRTKALCYNCTAPGCEGLQLLVNGIDIVKA